MRLHRVAAVALALLAGGRLARGAEGPLPAPPAAHDFRLGALTLTALRSGGWLVPNDGSVFGASPAEMAKMLVEAGAENPTGDFTLSVDALLVRLPGHLALMDAGLGPSDHGALMDSLALAGVAPDQITDVLVTHGHLDHVGGLLGRDGRPAFPRATIRMSEREWASMRSETETKALAAVIAPQVRTFAPGHEVLPGVTAIALYGHTPGHVGYEIRSAGQRLEDIGDMAHSAVVNLARPDLRDSYDVDPAAGTAIRLAELKRLAAAHERVFAPHFPFPGVGWIEGADDRYRWRPDATPAR